MDPNEVDLFLLCPLFHRRRPDFTLCTTPKTTFRECSRYLEMCLAYITGDDCTDLCSNFPSRAERVSSTVRHS